MFYLIFDTAALAVMVACGVVYAAQRWHDHHTGKGISR